MPGRKAGRGRVIRVPVFPFGRERESHIGQVIDPVSGSRAVFVPGGIRPKSEPFQYPPSEKERMEEERRRKYGVRNSEEYSSGEKQPDA